jgi:hypothetical protein
VSAIYLRHGDEFVAMSEQPYEAESVLQALLADHPEILSAGDDRHSELAEWVLVRREAGIADAEAAPNRWSLDHLFLDARRVPTLVEVKRSVDTRARREVVAQMLDYAANATTFWKVETLQAWFETECERNEIDAATMLNEAFGVSDPESYWATVQTNLAAERIRLVFVADEIAAELRSIVEFLNRQMRETEVLAIEVKQYVDADGARQTIVPRVVGRTEAARAAKSPAARGAGAAFDFSAASPAFHDLLAKMDVLANELGLTVKDGRTGRNYQPPAPEPDAKYTSGIGIYATGRGAEFYLGIFREFGADDLADELLQRLRAIAGRPVNAVAAPAIPCEALTVDWNRARTELIEPYFQARSQLSKSLQAPASESN